MRVAASYAGVAQDVCANRLISCFLAGSIRPPEIQRGSGSTQCGVVRSLFGSKTQCSAAVAPRCFHRPPVWEA